MSGSKQLREVAANLRHIANILASADSDELASPVTVDVRVLPVTWAWGGPSAKETVDQIAAALGVAADWPKGRADGTSFQSYSGSIAGDDQPWKLTFEAYLRRPDPRDEMREENERLKAKLAEIERLASDG